MLHEANKRHRRFWRRIRRTIFIFVAALVLLAALGPSLLPSSYLAGLLQKNLQASFGRPVRVSNCALGWFKGVSIGDIWIASGSARPDDWLLHVEGLTLKYEPWELPEAVTSKTPHLGRAAIQRLSVRVVRDKNGHLDLLESSAPPPDFKSLEVLDGSIELLDEQSGTRRQVSDLRMRLGRLTGTQRAYLTAGGRLLFPDVKGSPDTGLITLNGLLDKFDLNNLSDIAGGCDLEWQGVDLAYFVPDLRVAGLVQDLELQAPTDGQAKVTVDAASLVHLDGSISFSHLTAGSQQKRLPDIEFDRLTFGFTGSYNKATGQATLTPLQVSGASSSLKVAGQLLRKADGLLYGNLGVTGVLSLGPLKEDVRPLGEALKGFSSAMGTVRIENFDLKFAGNLITVVGAVDLSRTEFSWKPWFVKPMDRRTALSFDAQVNLAEQDLQVRRLLLQVAAPAVTEPTASGHAEVEVRAGTEGELARGADGKIVPWSRPLKLEVRVPDMKLLPRHVPAAAGLVDELGLAGALTVRATAQPQSRGGAVTLLVDGRDLSLQTTKSEIGKPAGTPLAVFLTGNLNGPGGRPECTRAEFTLAESVITFAGNIQAEAPQDSDHPSPLRFAGRVDARGVQEWLRLARLMQPRLMPERPFLALLGNLNLDLSGHLDEKDFFVDAQVEATRAAVELSLAPGRVEQSERLLVKPLGKVAEGRVTVKYTPAADQLDFSARGTLDETTITFQSSTTGLRGVLAATAPKTVSLEFAVRSGNVETLLKSMPAVEARVAPYHPAGAAEASVRGVFSDKLDLAINLDLGKTSYEVADEVKKPAGLAQSFVLRATCSRPEEGRPMACDIRELKLTTGPSSLTIGGRAVFDFDVLKTATSSPFNLIRAMQSAAATLKLDLVQDESLRQFSRRWRELSDTYEFQGRATATLDLSGTRQLGTLRFIADATAAGFQYGEGTRKPVGTPAQVDLGVKTGTMAGEVVLDHITLDIADTHVNCGGTVYLREIIPQRPSDVAGFDLHLEGRSGQLARLTQLLPVRSLRQLRPQGGITFALDVAADPFGVAIDRAEFTFNKTRVTYNGTDISADGHVALTRHRLLADTLALAVGQSAVVVAADLSDPLETPRGPVAVTGACLDLDALMATFGLPPIGQTKPVVGIPPTWPALARFLCGCNVAGHLALDRFDWTDETGIPYHWTAFSSDFSLAGGKFDVAGFKAVMLGGVVTGRAHSDLAVENPNVLIAYETRNLMAGEEMAPMITRLFPGMVVEGRANQHFEAVKRLFLTKDQVNFPVGRSTFEATDGSLVGPGAPPWLSDLLPGLKLTKFVFKRVQCATIMEADGRTVNDMLFLGSPYSIYIRGYTKADGRTDYLLGVDLFNSMSQGDFARGVEDGQVPLLRYYGRIANSQWAEQNIRYLLPYEVAYELFLRRTLLYKILARQGESRQPNFAAYDFDKPPAKPAAGQSAVPPAAATKQK